ncbi:MAG: hypothetical protein GQ527_06470 [Bacteroidales bacterium]|nr:hypothetical protein [Bacteroidales bacterium]
MLQVANSKFLGVFKLNEKYNNLGEIVIAAKTTETEIDKDIVFITKKNKTGTSDTKDVLNKLSGIHYDYYLKALTVDGEKNIMLLVNGLQKDDEYIKNISPDRIKKVEIIRDPDGKYGIQNYAAVINIILKMNYEGIELSVNNDALFDPDAENKINILPLNTFYTSINYTKNIINVYGAISNYYKKINILSAIRKEYASGIVENSLMRKSNGYTYKYTTNKYTVGFDYYF